VRAGEVEPTASKDRPASCAPWGTGEDEGRIPAGTYKEWEDVIAAPEFDAHKMERLIALLDKTECRSCQEAMLWLALRMFPQSDASLVSFARKESNAVARTLPWS